MAQAQRFEQKQGQVMNKNQHECIPEKSGYTQLVQSGRFTGTKLQATKKQPDDSGTEKRQQHGGRRMQPGSIGKKIYCKSGKKPHNEQQAGFNIIW